MKTLVIKGRLLVIVLARVQNWLVVLAGWGAARVRPRLDREILFSFRDGTKIVTGRTVGQALPVFEVCLEDCYRLDQLRSLMQEPPRVLIDVGAHVGSTTVAVTHKFPGLCVFCVEPSATSAHYLRRNLFANQVTGEVIEAAVGATAGTAEFEEFDLGSCGNRIVTRTANPKDTEACRAVPVVTMTDLLSKIKVGPVLVKLDCEGAEYDIVSGTPPEIWAPVSTVLIEYHRVAETGGFDEISDRLELAGFRCEWHQRADTRDGMGVAMFLRSS